MKETAVVADKNLILTQTRLRDAGLCGRLRFMIHQAVLAQKVSYLESFVAREDDLWQSSDCIKGQVS